MLLFLAVRAILVGPIKGVVEHMQRYAAAPEDARRIIQPAAGVTELREAEEALKSMQTELTSALRQKRASGPAWQCGQQRSATICATS